MLGIASYVTSSPRFMLVLVAVSAAAVVATQLIPLIESPAAAPGVGVQVITPGGVDDPVYAALFEESRAVPADPRRDVALEVEAEPITPGFSAPADEPAVAVDEVVSEIPVVVPSDPLDPSGTSENSLTLRPTFSWANVFGDSSTVNGRPINQGDVITAFDPSGTLIGRFTVSSEGQFGLMAVYEDDPTTVADEGAEPGDQITFMINGLPAAVVGPHDPVWTANGALLMLNLTAGQPGI